VQLGRPILWGLAHGGAKGVEHVLRSMLGEFDVTVGLSGVADLRDVNATHLAQAALALP
jgi:lactate 2-monooxygenase